MSKCLCELVLIAERNPAYLSADGSTDFRVMDESKKAALLPTNMKQRNGELQRQVRGTLVKWTARDCQHFLYKLWCTAENGHDKECNWAFFKTRL